MTDPTRQWLKQVVQVYAHRYQDRICRQVEEVLATYTSLRPRTDHYAHAGPGSTSILILIHGTLPVVFRGAQYNIPVQIWLPPLFPQQPPHVYVVPTQAMMIRPGQFVDANGKVTHPLLHYWHTQQEPHLLQLLQGLRDTFGQEPPVFARPANMPMPVNASIPIVQQQHQQSMARPVPVSVPVQPSVRASPNAMQTQQHQQPIATPYWNAANAAQSHAPLRQSPTPPPYVSPTNTNNMPGVSTPVQLPAATVQSPPSMASLPTNNNQTSLQIAVREKMTRTVTQLHSVISSNMEQLLTDNQRLVEGDQQLKEQLTLLEKETLQLQQASQILEQETLQSQTSIHELGSFTWTDERLDELVQVPHPLHHQLMETLAEESAMEDSIYQLGRALQHETVDVVHFMKWVRVLAREQFLKRALILKIRTKMAAV